MKLLTSRTAGFALVALLGGVMIFQILMALGLPQGAPWSGQLDANRTLRIVSFLACLISLFAILVVLEKLGLVRLLRMRRVINGILWFLATFLLLSAVATMFFPGGIEQFVMIFLALAGSILCMIVARAPFVAKT